MAIAKLSQGQRDAIEAMIDKTSVHELLQAIAQICYAKADHIRDNWQDEVTAKCWERDAHRVERAA